VEIVVSTKGIYIRNFVEIVGYSYRMYSGQLSGDSGVLKKDLYWKTLWPQWDPETFHSTNLSEEIEFMACVYSGNLNGNI
jgi:hypothetical protein